MRTFGYLAPVPAPYRSCSETQSVSEASSSGSAVSYFTSSSTHSRTEGIQDDDAKIEKKTKKKRGRNKSNFKLRLRLDIPLISKAFIAPRFGGTYGGYPH
mmetsp:Transcript_11351/g.25698  ORF Transcript_11351/g.25698 Transcript_11351/m.25698 type:complete len:100 (-) Transcript_11351:369-668(-)